MLTLKDLKKEVEPYKNTLVIGDYFSIVRLVDVIEDTLDYYWVFDSKKGIYHASAVGGWIPLKGFINDVEYHRLVTVWNLNNIQKAI